MAELRIKGKKKYIKNLSTHLKKEHPSTRRRMKITVVILSLAILSALIMFKTSNTQHSFSDVTKTPESYLAAVYLKVSPNMESRVPTQYDIDTKLNLQTSDGRVYHLYESRDPNDFFNYGKNFVVRIK